MFKSKSATIILILSSLMSVTFSVDANTINSKCKEVSWAVQSDNEEDVLFPFDDLTGNRNVTLICKTNANYVCKKCRKVWYGGPYFSLLSLDGFPSEYVSKYWPFVGINGFKLTIRNFSTDDLNQDYICSIDEYSCKRNLTTNMFYKHLLDRDVPGDDTNSNISKVDPITMAGLFSGVFVFVIFITIFLIKHKCTCNLCKKQLTSTDSQPSRSVSEPSNDSQNVPNSENKNLFISPIAYKNDEHKQKENDALI